VMKRSTSPSATNSSADSIKEISQSLSTLRAPRYREPRMTRGQCGWLAMHCPRLALFHTRPVWPGTPERQA
jgi:hypothetical protein